MQRIPKHKIIIFENLRNIINFRIEEAWATGILGAVIREALSLLEQTWSN